MCDVWNLLYWTWFVSSPPPWGEEPCESLPLTPSWLFGENWDPMGRCRGCSEGSMKFWQQEQLQIVGMIRSPRPICIRYGIILNECKRLPYYLAPHEILARGGLRQPSGFLVPSCRHILFWYDLIAFDTSLTYSVSVVQNWFYYFLLSFDTSLIHSVSVVQKGLLFLCRLFCLRVHSLTLVVVHCLHCTDQSQAVQHLTPSLPLFLYPLTVTVQLGAHSNFS